MVLSNYRSTLDWWLVPLAKSLKNVNPNTITWISLVVALGGGVAFWRSGPDQIPLLVLAWAAVIVNGVLDVLDGKLAQITGKESPKGDYLDHVFDRLADTAFILGIAFSPWARIEVGVFALLGTLLTSYLGTQAQAVGIGRNYGGLLGRADRMVLIMAIPLVEMGFVAGGASSAQAPWFRSVLELMLYYFAIVGILTAIQRFWMGLRSFDGDGQLRD